MKVSPPEPDPKSSGPYIAQRAIVALNAISHFAGVKGGTWITDDTGTPQQVTNSDGLTVAEARAEESALECLRRYFSEEDQVQSALEDALGNVYLSDMEDNIQKGSGDGI